MKLRIDPKKIRFRLSEEEAKTLMMTHLVEETIHLPSEQKITMAVKIADHINLLNQDNIMMLTVPLAQVADLMQNPDKNGICHTFNNNQITVSFQVDMACESHC
ncbi:MAG: hypothetical protein ABSF18_03200 [Gammaproteobacteria bacterium]|jgi:hypothetical protein